MHINGDSIRLDPKAKGTLFEPKDWELVRGHRMIRHKPSGCIFAIDCDNDAIQKDTATVYQFSARLVHVCDHRTVPSFAVQRPLGRAAIVVFLQEIGAWRPVVTEVPNGRLRNYGKPRPS